MWPEDTYSYIKHKLGLLRKQTELEMWANAQPDGRPAEYR